VLASPVLSGGLLCHVSGKYLKLVHAECELLLQFLLELCDVAGEADVDAPADMATESCLKRSLPDDTKPDWVDSHDFL